MTWSLVRESLEQVIKFESKEVEDNQFLLQFAIRMATTDLQNAENVRSQAEQRLDQRRL
ncbi:MAG: hypothetical protein L0387_14010 [Acidobacteria bacterium]|nr:hypothetical protein [Acidobacteriota bacterium]MCI0622751.1 hypothetical protein [Acidobacteriota bacterium]MCI0721199.1 hypothetical protein [Acidobacteriota bacterium]